MASWRLRGWACVAVLGVGMAGCGEDEQEPSACDPLTHDGCGDGQVCEEVQGEEPACFAPVEVHGRVFDMTTDSGIEGASVVALDANRAARSDVARSDGDGQYALRVPVRRMPDGTPVAEDAYARVTLRVAAQTYQAFPLPPRLALPIDLDAAGRDDEGSWVVASAATDVALLPLDDAMQGGGILRGRVTGAGEDTPVGGVLVVAEQDGSAVSTAITGSNGEFTLFNVPQGDVSVAGYLAGIIITPTELSVGSEPVEDLMLSAEERALASVGGSVNIVNAPGGAETSVILVVESTFLEDAARGEVPAGLRAGEVSGQFEIHDVPPGRYVVLAAFENDDLVRDPDTSIAGTQILHIEVTDTDETVALDASFKVTEALEVESPGADGMEPVGDAMPTFVWADDSSEDGYELRVYDAFGDLVHEALDVPRVTGNTTVSYTWADADLTPGMVYQFRATSFRDSQGERVYISQTEDLRGAFTYQP